MAKPGKKQTEKPQLIKGPCNEIVGSKACKKALSRGASHCSQCGHKGKK